MIFSQKKVTLLLALLAYLALLIMAIIFFKERLNVDSSYYFFKTLNQGRFHIEHDRLVLAIAEWPVLLASKLHLPLRTIVMIYSVWHVLFFLLPGLLLSLRYRQSHYLLLFVLLQLVGIMYGFVCPVFEQYYGTALLAAMYIVLRQTTELRVGSGMLIAVMAFLGVGSHPFNLILFGLLITLDFSYRKNKAILCSMLALIPLWILFKFFHISDYEKGKINWIFDIMHNKTYRSLGEWSHWKAHFIFLWQYYKEVLLGLAVLTVLCVQQQGTRQLMWVFVFFFGALFLINFSYAVKEYSGYNEQVCYLLVPLVLIPLLTEPISQLSAKPLQIILFCCCLYIIPSRLLIQYRNAQVNAKKTTRVMQWIADARQMNSCKNYVYADAFRDINTVTGWDISYSSLIFSAFTPEQQQVSIVPLEENNPEILESIDRHSWLFRFGEVEPIESLNPAYFRLCDQDAYKKLEQ